MNTNEGQFKDEKSLKKDKAVKDATDSLKLANQLMGNYFNVDEEKEK